MHVRHALLIFANAAFSVIYLTGSPQQGTANTSMMQSCTMKVGGAEVAVAETRDGIAVNVTTKTGDVAELRRRTEGMAKMHAAHSNMHGEMMPFDAKYED